MMSWENYDPCFPDQPVVDLYLPMWANQPAFKSKPVFVWADDSPHSTTWAGITYSELNSSAQAIAFRLLSNLRRGDTILVLSPPGLGLVKILFACQRAGLVAVPIIPPDPSAFSLARRTPAHHHLLRALSQTKPKAAVADPCYISAVARSIKSMTVIDRLSVLLQELQWLSTEDLTNAVDVVSQFAAAPQNPSEYSGCKPDEAYLIQYTSGATGIPKPVVVTAGAAAHNVRVARKAYDLQPSSMIVSWLPQYHDCGLMFLLLTIVSGATCVLTSPTAFLRRPRLWLELITEFQATCTPVPSFALPLVARRGGVEQGKLPLELGSMRNLILINEPIYASPVEDFIREFKSVGLGPSSISPSYGLAENCTFVSTAWRCNSPDVPSCNKLLPSAKLSALDDEEMEIVVANSETGEVVDDGVEGEIWVYSPSNASGYLGHPSLTREIFAARIRGRVGRRFVRTGDRGVVVGEERYLYVLGRSSDVIRVGGGRSPVHAHYIETAALVGRERELRGGCIAAFGVERRRGEEVVVAAELQKGVKGGGVYYRRVCEGIREGVRSEVEGVGVGVVALVEGGSLPKTTSGKLRRWEAKERLLGGKLPVVFMARFEEREEEGVGSAADGGREGKQVWGGVVSLLSLL